jgi:hypothetical protein
VPDVADTWVTPNFQANSVKRTDLRNVLRVDRTISFHRKMGHLNYKSLRLLSHLSEGIVLDNDPADQFKICIQTKASFPPSNSLAKRIGDLTHLDLCSIKLLNVKNISLINPNQIKM